MGELTDHELEQLNAENDRRMQELGAQGVTVVGQGPAVDRYVVVLLEALVGDGVRRRCQEEASLWFAERLDEMEQHVAKVRREMTLLGNGRR
jgi:hypothetical protein